ncbi:hypothetical protein, partial [uncultured Sutterella sp.]|uniref:hypothetical protein n=1 Tax=uncultured Sutterella sp. TaxID=286133 RepID=UPI00260CF2DD
FIFKVGHIFGNRPMGSLLLNDKLNVNANGQPLRAEWSRLGDSVLAKPEFEAPVPGRPKKYPGRICFDPIVL